MSLEHDVLIWVGIAFCLTQSAIFSGLNLAFFSLGRLQLEVEAKRGSESAVKILKLREDSNFLLATILWGNVSINVMLTLLSDMVMAGVAAFMFSTIAITYIGEIIPQAYFSRNALKVAAFLTPVIKFYQLILFPVAKITSLVLDGWLGREGITYFREQELKALIKAHIEAEEAEVDHLEGVGALNFLAIDSVPVTEEGEEVDPTSILALETKLDLPIVPEPDTKGFDEFLKKVHSSGHKWVILTDMQSQPLLLLDADGLIRSALLDDKKQSSYHFCHRPVVIEDSTKTLGYALQQLKKAEQKCQQSDDVLDEDVVLIWNEEVKRVITGADILGRLLKGIKAELE